MGVNMHVQGASEKTDTFLFSFGDAMLGIMQNKLMSDESSFICNLFWIQVDRVHHVYM